MLSSFGMRVFLLKGGNKLAQLVYPDYHHEAMIKAYLQETYDFGEDYINGDGGLQFYDDYRTWLKKEKQNHLGINLDPGYVPGTTYFYLENDQIVGTINLRHCLNDSLNKIGGHIGYSILPSKRQLGYATSMLQEVIKIAKRWEIYPLLLTCKQENIASRKTIEKCGGKFENKYYDKETKETYLRFWIGEKDD